MIGGEFPIAATDVLNADVRHSKMPDVYTYSSGRAALYQILKYLQREKGTTRILLPDYLCSSVLVPVKTLQLEYLFYPIDEQLKLIKDNLKNTYKKGDVILIINYFGLQNLDEEIAYIKSIDKNAIIIEDDVQAYYEFKKDLGNVDFKFTSLRKTFAVPDGGLVKTKYKLPKVKTPNTFGQYKAAAGLLKSMREGNFNDQIYLEMFEKGEDLIDSELECGMSRIAEKLYGIMDEERVRVRRQNNARYLIDELEKKGFRPILPLLEDHVPLFIPMYIENRDDVRRRMFQHEMFCPVHWPLEGMHLNRGADMTKHELSLIIDQRYNVQDMNLIVSLI